MRLGTAVSPVHSRSTPLTQGIALIRLMVQSGHSLGVTGIARTLDMPKSSVHRLLQSLQELGFVQRLETGRYTLCADIFDFIHEIALNFGRNFRLEDQLRAAARRLDCSVYLNMLGRRDTYVICAAGDEGNTARLGIHSRAYASSAGKILIAQKDPSDWLDYAPDPAEKPTTPFTTLSRTKFLAELRKAKKAGLAWNHRETSLAHVSLATVVREPFIPVPRLAVALVFRLEDFETRDRANVEKDLLELASELERELGSR
jgi:DNA-binding IclR family transcriptional regulator